MRVSELLHLQTEFFAALGGAADAEPAGVRGRFEIYRYAYFERIRASIEEDYPALFAFLGMIDAEAVTRDLLARNHPRSWTLAEASLPILASVEPLLLAAGRGDDIAEARRLAALDEAESLAAWLEEWPEAAGPRANLVAEFAAGRIRLARTKTWREAADRVFWRGEHGVGNASRAELAEFSAYFPLVIEPMTFAEFVEGVGSIGGDPTRVARFLERGAAAGWLRFVPV
jgi:hypothetical protein